MKKGFYTLIGTTILAAGLALATPASAQWNGMDHSGTSYGSNAAPMEENHEMSKEHHGKKHHEMHKHHKHHKHHKADDAKKDDAAKDEGKK